MKGGDSWAEEMINQTREGEVDENRGVRQWSPQMMLGCYGCGGQVAMVGWWRLMLEAKLGGRWWVLQGLIRVWMVRGRENKV